jgi:hypothetical protein
LEKFPKYGGRNSESSDFAATIINQFAEADTQNAFTSGGNPKPSLKFETSGAVWCPKETISKLIDAGPGIGNERPQK